MILKPLSLFLMTTVLSWSSSSYATHAYRSMNCKSQTHQLNYKGNYPLGGNYGISNSESALEFVALPQVVEGSETDQNTLNDADVIFNEVTSVQVGEVTKESDCYFDHEEWQSRKSVVINLITESASQALNLKQGSTIELICEESTDWPNSKSEN